MTDQKKPTKYPSNCAKCTGELPIPSLAEYVRCFRCGAINRIIRNRGAYITMTVNEKRIPANKIVSIFEQKHEERTSKTIANFMLGFIGALAGMVLTTYVEQYEHYKQEKRQERKERETDEETERTRDSKSSQTNEQKRLE